jgi:hypothetical protein
MESERSLKIVVGYQPQFDSPLSDVKEAGLTAMVATVLSTYRSNNPDMFCDHRLWLACTRAVTEVVEADQTLVFAEDPPRVVAVSVPPLVHLSRMRAKSPTIRIRATGRCYTGADEVFWLRLLSMNRGIE